jgi:dTMP kinase
LFAAARAELVERVVQPALAAGRLVVSDRFIDSSLAYQGVARGLGVEAIAELNHWAADGLRPDLTILLVIGPQQAVARGAERDRFESEGTRLQQQVLEAYEAFSSEEPQRWRRIDAARPPEEVHRDVMAAIAAAQQ